MRKKSDLTGYLKREIIMNISVGSCQVIPANDFFVKTKGYKL
jgi:hypothetical protein